MAIFLDLRIWGRFLGPFKTQLRLVLSRGSHSFLVHWRSAGLASPCTQATHASVLGLLGFVLWKKEMVVESNNDKEYLKIS